MHAQAAPSSLLTRSWHGAVLVCSGGAMDAEDETALLGGPIVGGVQETAQAAQHTADELAAAHVDLRPAASTWPDAIHQARPALSAQPH